MLDNLYYNNPAFQANYQYRDPNDIFGQSYGMQVPGMSVNRNRRSGFSYRQPTMAGSLQQPGLSLNANRRDLSSPEQGRSIDMGQALNYAEIGLGGYEQGKAGTDEFSIDPNAGFKGSAAGFAKGGVVGAIIGGVAGQVGTFMSANKNLKNLNTAVNAVQYDVNGNPIYQGHELLHAQKSISALDDGEKKIKRSIDPATRIFSGIFGTRKRIRRKRGQLQDNLRTGQLAFNQEAEKANRLNSARNAYYDSFNRDDRMYNLYNR